LINKVIFSNKHKYIKLLHIKAPLTSNQPNVNLAYSFAFLRACATFDAVGRLRACEMNSSASSSWSRSTPWQLHTHGIHNYMYYECYSILLAVV